MIKALKRLIHGRRHLEQDADGAEALAQRLEALGGYRVLRALNPSAGVETLRELTPGNRIGVVVDSETTGLDASTDRMVEVAAQRFAFDPGGRVTSIERVRSWLEDPKRPMPERLSKLTGLSDADLAGKEFDDASIVNILKSADVIIAHNAAFDRPFFDRRFPELRGSRWGCSLSQLDWLALGYDGRSLGHLLFQSGHYFDGHRAANDVCALTALIARPLPDGRTILSHLLDACATDTFRFEAVGAPFEAKDLLKQRGYRWDGTGRFWWREVTATEQAQELEWLERNVYMGRGGPRTRQITARERFAEAT